MKRFLIFLTSMVGFLGVSTTSEATWYTNEANFLSALSSNYYLEEFNGWGNGTPLNGAPSWNSPGANGFGWTASADQGLYSLPIGISTSSPFRFLNISFTGRPVTAFGLLIGNSDQNGNAFAGDSTIKLSTGETQTITQGATQSFLGWVGGSELTGVQLVSSHWVIGDHVYTSGPVPEPSTISALCVGFLVALRKRKRSKVA